MNLEKPNLQEPAGHFNEGGVLVEGPKKPRNVLIEKNGEVVPIFGEQTEGQQQETAGSSELETAESATPATSETQSILPEEIRIAFEELVGEEKDSMRILKLRKELGINNRQDELRAEEAAARVKEFMKNNRP